MTISIFSRLSILKFAMVITSKEVSLFKTKPFDKSISANKAKKTMEFFPPSISGLFSIR